MKVVIHSLRLQRLKKWRQQQRPHATRMHSVNVLQIVCERIQMYNLKIVQKCYIEWHVIADWCCV